MKLLVRQTLLQRCLERLQVAEVGGRSLQLLDENVLGGGVVQLLAGAFGRTLAYDQLIIRQACYWMNLEGEKPSSPKTPTVAVPIANIFDGPNLIEMFQRLEQGVRI